MIPFAGFFFTAMVAFVAGCGMGPTPRLVELLEGQPIQDDWSSPENLEWTKASKIGLVLHADDTGENASPAISPTYRETLTRRTEKFLKNACAFREILYLPPVSRPNNLSQALETHLQHFPVSYQILVVLSGGESTGPVKIGEATVMTQMSGTVIEHSALAEIGVLRTTDKKIVFLKSGRGTETLEQLDVPIGDRQLSPIDAREILRAQAGQQALDRALVEVARVCQTGKTDTR